MSNKYDRELHLHLNKGRNRVQRALQVANQLVGSNYIGSRLNTSSSAMVNTLTSIKSRGVVHKNTFIQMYQKPEVKAAFSFAIDGSDSMNYNQPHTRSGTYWKECISLLHALHMTCQNIGVETCSSLCMYTYGESDVPMASSRYKPVVNMIKGLNERWTKDLPDRLRKKRCSGGTSIVSYGEAAIDMIAQSNATHRIAFFLTDGQDYEKRYLESMRLQALSQGIKLVGIGLGVEGDSLPNGISGHDAMDIAPRMMSHLEALIKSKTGIESNDSK